MPRGKPTAIGTETVNALGYTQVKTEDRGWVGKHILVLEEKLGRKLQAGERAAFEDGDKTNFDPNNIVLKQTSNARTLTARIARWRAEIKDREEWIEIAQSELGD